jgi:hypothetical protein
MPPAAPVDRSHLPHYYRYELFGSPDLAVSGNLAEDHIDKRFVFPVQSCGIPRPPVGNAADMEVATEDRYGEEFGQKRPWSRTMWRISSWSYLTVRTLLPNKNTARLCLGLGRPFGVEGDLPRSCVGIARDDCRTHDR